MLLTPGPNRHSLNGLDLCVYVLLLGLGALQFLFIERAPGFVNDDVAFFDRADTLLHHLSYSANFVRERVQPPGFPATLAIIYAITGGTHDTMLRAMCVFITLGFLLSYEVIRRQRGRPIAAATCLLLASSPSLFPFFTSWLWPSFPYFFVSMFVLFLVPRLEAEGTRRRQFFSASLVILLLTAAVMIQSAGIALVGGLLGWAALSYLGDRAVGSQHLKLILPIILIPLLAQVLWLRQGTNPKDWPVAGYGDSYLAQLKLKSGNYPEMGLASTKDVVLRVKRNAKDRTLFLGETLTHLWINPSWASPLVAGPVVLILLGVGCSLLKSDLQLCALYYIGYECIYLLWPWSFEVPRFALPVLPLACLYLAEGGLALVRWSRQYARRVGAIFLPLAMTLTFFSVVQIRQAETGSGLQNKISIIFWLACTFVCVRLVWKGPVTSWDSLSKWQTLLDKKYSMVALSVSPVQLLGAFVVTYLIFTGVAADISIGRQNLVSGMAKFENSPEIQAARWIEYHTDPNAIIASRIMGLIYHYSRRRVIWFPPIANPRVLMEGIRKHHIGYVVIVDRSFNYYLPGETTCFDLLYAAYPRAFRLAEAKGRVKIYEVLQDSSTQPSSFADLKSP
jgi:Dolichyl-phosphate-mannose-protein mannosyltransferase